MIGPATIEHERTSVQAGKYQLSFFDGKGPVIIQGPYGLWNAQGDDARIIKHLENLRYARVMHSNPNPGYVDNCLDHLEHYLDMCLEERLSGLQGKRRSA